MVKTKPNNTFLWAPLCMLLFALLPEYVFPVLMAVTYFKTLSFKGINKAFFGSMGICLTAYAAWQFIGLFYSGSFVSGLTGIGLWLFMLLAYFSASTNITTEEKLENTFFAGAISGGICGGIGILQMLLYHYGELIHPALKTFFNPFWHPLDKFVADVAINHLVPDFAMKYIQRKEFIAIVTRASGTFTNPVFFAIFLVTMLPFAAHCLFNLKGKVKKITGAVSLVLIVGGIAVSYSRGPYLAAAVGFAVLLLYGGKRLLALAGLGAAGIAGFAVVAPGVFKRLLTLFSSNDISINTRSDIWKACFEMLRGGKWVFGYGTGVNNIREILHNTCGIRQPHAHNLFLQVLLENGVIGVGLLISAILCFALIMLKLARQGKKERYTAITLLSSMVGFFMCGMTDYLFYGLKPMCCMMLVFGMAYAAKKIYIKQ